MLFDRDEICKYRERQGEWYESHATPHVKPDSSHARPDSSHAQSDAFHAGTSHVSLTTALHDASDPTTTATAARAAGYTPATPPHQHPSGSLSQIYMTYVNGG